MEPWKTEPDVWMKMTPDGYIKLIVRHLSIGHLCGYVGVPESHILYNCQNLDFEVHGGITFTGRHRVCKVHIKEFWYFGFDCGHSNDYTPYMIEPMIGPENYRDFNYVLDEVDNLLDQIKKVTEVPDKCYNITIS